MILNFNSISWNHSKIYVLCFSFSVIEMEKKRHLIVEKRKISYFCLARYLIQHWISPNQDDLSYSARTFISG